MNEYLNSEGYADPTSYFAIKQCKGEQNMDIKSGRIYEMHGNSGAFYALAIRTWEKSFLYYRLFDNEPGYVQYEVEDTDGTLYYVDLSKINYSYSSKITSDYVARVSDSTMFVMLQDIQDEIFGNHLHIQTDPAVVANSSDDSEDAETISSMRIENQKLRNEIDVKNGMIADLDKKLIKAEAKIEVLKELYDKELGR